MGSVLNAIVRMTNDHEDNDEVSLGEELKTFVGSVCNGGRH